MSQKDQSCFDWQRIGKSGSTCVFFIPLPRGHRTDFSPVKRKWTRWLACAQTGTPEAWWAQRANHTHKPSDLGSLSGMNPFLTVQTSSDWEKRKRQKDVSREDLHMLLMWRGLAGLGLLFWLGVFGTSLAGFWCLLWRKQALRFCPWPLDTQVLWCGWVMKLW